MSPTQKKSGERMSEVKRENLLCRLLEYGGKNMDNESLAFQKNFSSSQ